VWVVGCPIRAAKDFGLILNLVAAVGAEMPPARVPFEVNTAQSAQGQEQDFSAVILEMKASSYGESKTMIKIKRLGCVLLLTGITATTVHSQDTAGDYVAPSEATPRGRAPKMQIQLLTRGEPTKQYAVIFYQGDEAFSGLLEFAEKYHVTSAHFTAIGSAESSDAGVV
jgi:hypothetical protein